MVSLKNMTRFLLQKTGRPLAILSKHSPKIMVGAGMVGFVGTVVLASVATLKVKAIMDEHNSDMEKINKVLGSVGEEVYSSEDAQKDVTIRAVQTVVALLKVYGPAIAVGLISLVLILRGYGILENRNLAVMAAYEALAKGFKVYRKRVTEELGSEKDRQFRYGITKEKVDVEETDENGKTKVVKRNADKFPKDPSIYAKIFDELSPEWSKIADHNLIFLRSQQEYANTLLHIRGHVFLNEVYDMLGIPRTQEGTMVGWVEDAGGDNFISFGIYDLDQENSRAFINGYTDTILLDFNVDGLVWNMI